MQHSSYFHIGQASVRIKDADGLEANIEVKDMIASCDQTFEKEEFHTALTNSAYLVKKIMETLTTLAKIATQQSEQNNTEETK